MASTWHFPLCRRDSVLQCPIIKHTGGELREGWVHAVLHHQPGDKINVRINQCFLKADRRGAGPGEAENMHSNDYIKGY